MGYAGIRRNLEKQGIKKTFLEGISHRRHLFRARGAMLCRRRMDDAGGQRFLDELLVEEEKIKEKDEGAYLAYQKHIERKRDAEVFPKLAKRYLEDRSLILSDFEDR